MSRGFRPGPSPFFKKGEPKITSDDIQEYLSIIALSGVTKKHLKEVGNSVPLQSTIHVTGGAVNSALIRAKSKWMRDCQYVVDEESSVKGAAMLGRDYLETA